jgi:hypothetical protein
MNCLPQLRQELLAAGWRLREDRAAAGVLAPLEGGVTGAATGVAAPLEGAVAAARAQPRRRAWFSGRTIAVNLAVALVTALAGLGAAGVFREGTPLGPETPASAGSAEGVAVKGTMMLLGLRTADPGGGLPWGVRVVRTTRGLTCLAIGRVDYGTVGVLGRDGAFHDDGRFHPLAPDFFESLGCDATDADGRGFVNVALRNVPASALWGESRGVGGCLPPVTRRLRGLLRPRTLRQTAQQLPGCTASDMREVYAGLLGPQARSITYATPGGGTRTVPVLAPYGAYLLVFREGAVPGNQHASGSTGGPGLSAGEILSVSYAGGQRCDVPRDSMFESCPPVGFTAPRGRTPTAATLATAVHVQVIAATRYCSDESTIVACERDVPQGYHPLAAGGEHKQPPSVLARVTFRSRVAISSSASFYETELRYAKHHGCEDQGGDAPTDHDVRAGALVAVALLVPTSCAGSVEGWVEYVPAVGATTATPVIGLPGQGSPIVIGRFRFHAP